MEHIDSPKLASGVHEYVIHIVEDPGRRYPSGELVFSIDGENRETMRILAAGLYLPRDEDETLTESFDDSFVIVRRTTKSQRLAGLQVLRFEPGPASVPEVIADIIERNDLFLLDALTTVMMQWAPVERLCAKERVQAKLEREWLLAAELRRLSPSRGGRQPRRKIQQELSGEPIWAVRSAIA